MTTCSYYRLRCWSPWLFLGNVSVHLESGRQYCIGLWHGMNSGSEKLEILFFYGFISLFFASRYKGRSVSW